jgi:DNA gyrase subunit B
MKHRMYISHSNELAGKSLSWEIIYNAFDECRNPKSPADKITVEFDERSGFLRVTDNGRGIPTDILEDVLTSLNYGSNIDSAAKAEKGDVLGQNGTGTLAYTALAERVEIISYRGGTENTYLKLIFEEGEKKHEERGKCHPDKHGMEVYFKPSKILGKNTRIVWSHIHDDLINLQFTEKKKKIAVTSVYTDKKGVSTTEKYKNFDFVDILKFKNGKEAMISDRIALEIRDDNVREEVGGRVHKRFVNMDIAFVFTKVMTPYIDSFSNGNNTVDNGSHLDGTFEALCRFFQTATKASMSEKERDKLDIKWDDVKTGLSLAVSLKTSMEELYTGQTKQKVQNDDLEKLVKELVTEALQLWGDKNPTQLKDLCNVVKMNARVRREGEKVRSAVMKDSITNWSSFRMKNFDPCTNRGKEYKELYIIEGDSAKGSLKLARDPKFQALFAIRGVSANVFKLDLNGILANKEFSDLIKVLGCNVGSKFDLSKLQYDKIIIATDADIDGLFIRTLLLSFFFKVYPEIILDGRLFIAEPPLYRVDSKKDPFVINREDYINRYIGEVIKHYQLAFEAPGKTPAFMDKSDLKEFLSATSSYVDEIKLLAEHYKVNERLIEILFHELAKIKTSTKVTEADKLEAIAKKVIQPMMNEISAEFKELYYDDADQLIKGVVDGRYQSIELSERLVRKGWPMIEMIEDYGGKTANVLMREIKTGALANYPLLSTLKILKKFQPNILHRFKGLGENQDEDIRVTLMDPNTRMLIRVNISTLQADLKIFNVLRGNSPLDAQARRQLVRSYQIPRDLIDT